jgi:hypothetical protein
VTTDKPWVSRACVCDKMPVVLRVGWERLGGPQGTELWRCSGGVRARSRVTGRPEALEAAACSVVSGDGEVRDGMRSSAVNLEGAKAGPCASRVLVAHTNSTYRAASLVAESRRHSFVAPSI